MRLDCPATIRPIRLVLCACLPLAGLVLLPGCSGSPSDEELGEIHYNLPPVDGMETRYYLPPMMKANPKQKSKEADFESSLVESPTTDSNSTGSESEPANDSTPLPTEDPAVTEAEATGLPPEPDAESAPTPEKSSAP